MTLNTAAGTFVAPKWLNIVLWVAQVVLAALYLFVGFMKTTQPIPALAGMMVWPGDVSPFLVRLVGVAELAGGLGLILPALFRILPGLTPLAAAALSLLQILAMVFHLVRGEVAEAWPINIVLLVISLFILWGRWKRAPIAPR
jgi:uncharacterized membrane protein YphA (DoxX/SURF4 family)